MWYGCKVPAANVSRWCRAQRSSGASHRSGEVVQASSSAEHCFQAKYETRHDWAGPGPQDQPGSASSAAIASGSRVASQ